MDERVMRLASDRRAMRFAAIAAASLLVTSVATVGQIEHRLRGTNTQAVAGASFDGSGPATTAGGSAKGAARKGSAGNAGRDGRGRGPGTTGPGGGTSGGGPGGGGRSGTRRVAVPDFGLRTQGVTAKSVKIGASYNRAACGDAGTLTAMFGAASAGDTEKSMLTYARYVNDNGGVGGRKIEMVFADDGGGDACPEKNLAAARQLADDDKVFAAIPGLHIVSDYLADHHVPVFGGRDDPESLARYGANGIHLTQEIDGNLTAWAAFGRHYLKMASHKPCLIHPESDAAGDWNMYEKLLVAKLARAGIAFTDIITYTGDVSTAQQQANTVATRAKAKGCDQAWFMAGNPIALIFITQAATNNLWFPTWTFTSYSALADTELAGRLMDQQQWENAIGLSTRVPPGKHPKDGNCKRIYERYNGNDGQSESVAAQIACALVLSLAEAMNRAVERTGVLTGDSLLVGADAVTNDFYYDSHVPIDWSFPSPAGPFKTKGFSHYTVVDWSSAESKYLFPEYPIYWRVMGPGRSGGENLEPMFKNG